MNSCHRREKSRCMSTPSCYARALNPADARAFLPRAEAYQTGGGVFLSTRHRAWAAGACTRTVERCRSCSRGRSMTAARRTTSTAGEEKSVAKCERTAHRTNSPPARNRMLLPASSASILAALGSAPTSVLVGRERSRSCGGAPRECSGCPPSRNSARGNVRGGADEYHLWPDRRAP